MDLEIVRGRVLGGMGLVMIGGRIEFPTFLQCVAMNGLGTGLL